jgi:hypothetical protein
LQGTQIKHGSESSAERDEKELRALLLAAARLGMLLASVTIQKVRI